MAMPCEEGAIEGGHREVPSLERTSIGCRWHQNVTCSSDIPCLTDLSAEELCIRCEFNVEYEDDHCMLTPM